MKTLAVIILIAGMVMAPVQIMPKGEVHKAGLSVIRRVTVDYYLLTTSQPIAFTVSSLPDTGCWLRVYTRLLFSSPDKDSGWYCLTFSDHQHLKHLRFDTKVSSSTKGRGNQPVGEWRSFYVHLFPGANSFQLTLDSASGETLGVRFLIHAPRKWEKVRLPGAAELKLVIKQDTLTTSQDGYFQIKTAEPYALVINGPCRIRLKTRIDFTPDMKGGQTYLLQIAENGKILQERRVRARRDKSAQYQQVKDVIPSIETRTGLKLGAGEHHLSIKISGTLARTAAIAVERLPNEKYE
jgi:hypothetical protein